MTMTMPVEWIARFVRRPVHPRRGQCSAASGQFRFDFDASSGPVGENPSGAYSDTSASSGLFVFAQVTCLQVTGNRASVGGTVTASNLYPEGSGIALTVLDNTPAAPDLISVQTALPAGPTANTPDCGSTFEPTFAVTGDIVVQDNIDDDDDDEDDDEDGD